MAKRALTDRSLKALKPAPRGKRYDRMDAIVPGLAVRVTEKGTKSFVLVARFPGSQNPTRRALGEYGELTLEKARSKARNWLELLVRGIDPQVQETNQREAEARKRRNTFAAVAEDFIKEKLPGERKGAEAERDIRREFMPAWSERPITEVTEEDVISVVKAAKGRGAPYQAHNLLTLARRLFKWAKAQRTYGLTASPCADLQPQQLIGKKVPRKRILSNEELQAFWHVTESLGYPYGPLFRMLAFTGQRKSEVAEARWSEIDLARKLWAIPAERMKADAAHLVPLSDDVVRLLKSLPRFTNGECLFSTNFGKTPVNGFSKGKARLDNAMGAALGRALEPFVIHDIRRTMRTGLSALPVPELVRELVIAHAKPGLHKVYDQFAYLDEKRHALELWTDRLRDIVSEVRS